MSDYRKYCEVLGVPFDATVEQIEKSYRLLVKVWHPDRFQHDPNLRDAATEKLQQINEAYEYLTSHTQGEQNNIEPYTDGECWYLGGDDRLRPIQFVEYKGRKSVVHVNELGVVLNTLAGNAPDQLAAYGADEIRLLTDNDGFWLPPDASLMSTSSERPNIREDEVIFRASDPEGLVQRISVCLRFRNSYYRKLFTKRCRERFSLQKRTPPPPKPTSIASKKTSNASSSSTMIGWTLAACGIVIIIITLSHFIGNNDNSKHSSSSVKKDGFRDTTEKLNTWAPPAGWTTEPPAPVKSTDWKPPAGYVAMDAPPEADSPADQEVSARMLEVAAADGVTTAASKIDLRRMTVDLRRMTFAAPAEWNRNENPNFVEAEFYLLGDDGNARMTIMQAGGDKQANIDRWIGQFHIAEGDEPAVTEIDVDGKTATMVDIRGTFSSQRPGQGSAENQRMLGFIIPFSASDNYFIKATGPQGTLTGHEDAIVKFVMSGKFK